MKELTEDLLNPNLVSDKLIELENRSQRNNLRIDGITEQSNKTWEEGKQKIMEVIKDKLDIENFIDIEIFVDIENFIDIENLIDIENFNRC